MCFLKAPKIPNAHLSCFCFSGNWDLQYCFDLLWTDPYPSLCHLHSQEVDLLYFESTLPHGAVQVVFPELLEHSPCKFMVFFSGLSCDEYIINIGEYSFGAQLLS